MRPYQNPNFIVNPKAGGGRIIQAWPFLRARVEDELGSVHALFTRHTGHAQDLTRHMLRGGADLIVAIGGDGTLNEVLNGLLINDQLIRPETHLAYVPFGTGGDFQRSLGMPADFTEIAKVLGSRNVAKLDVGRVELTNLKGYPLDRYFINMISFGMGGEVAVSAKSWPLRSLGGRLGFLGATVWSALRYRGRVVRMAVGDEELGDEQLITNVAIGNCEYHGGGMHPCPRAVADDGQLEVTTIEYLSLPRLLKDIRILYSNDVYRHKKVHHARTEVFRAEGFSRTRVEVDGEAVGTLPMRATVLPGILPLVLPPNSPMALQGQRDPAASGAA